ncbi:MAG: glycosyltransferase family 2 protein, partial [Acidobacteriota bacterium]
MQYPFAGRQDGGAPARVPDKPLISIFIPTYNRAGYLRECLESCLDQHFPSYEIVVGDDGSTDETRGLMERWAAEEPRIRYFRLEENTKAREVYALARNARGEYILRIGDDDRLVPGILSRYAETAKRYGADIVYGNLYCMDKAGVVTSEWKVDDYYGREDLLEALLKANQFPQPGSMVRNSLHWKILVEDGYVGFPPYPWLIPSLADKAIDYLDWVLLADRCVFKHIGAYSVYYRVHESQDSNLLFKNGSGESFVQRMVLSLYGLRRIFPRLDWEKDPVGSEWRAVLVAAEAFASVGDMYNASRFLARLI